MMLMIEVCWLYFFQRACMRCGGLDFLFRPRSSLSGNSTKDAKQAQGQLSMVYAIIKDHVYLILILDLYDHIVNIILRYFYIISIII